MDGKSRLEEKTSKLALDDQAPSSDHETGEATPPAAESQAAKPKRVRTGCLTCRERHLKCDEGLPVCQNCKRSNRTCKRGVRLNFIDTKVEDTQLVPQGADWNINFQDESRDIASEYKGGAGRYAPVHEDEMDVVSVAQSQSQSQSQSQAEVEAQAQAQGQAVMNVLNAPVMSHQPLPPIQSPSSQQYSNVHHVDSRRESIVSSNSGHSTQQMYVSEPSYQPAQQHIASSEEARDYLTSPQETLFMQVFVEEVGLWMDSMDPHKHVSRLRREW
jgi:hypothetical protein